MMVRPGTREFRFGIRQYSLRQEKGGVFHLYIQWRTVFVKGSDWGMSEYMLRSNPCEHIRTWVKLNKEMNFNMIRNWLGSVTEKQFYESCDELGIMIWDDFWINSIRTKPYDLNAFNNKHDGENQTFRNHPSIAVWCEVTTKARRTAPYGMDGGKHTHVLTAKTVISNLVPTTVAERQRPLGRKRPTLVLHSLSGLQIG